MANIRKTYDWEHGDIYTVSRDPRASNMARDPRNAKRAPSDTVVTRADGSQYVIAKPRTGPPPLTEAEKDRRRKARAQARKNAAYDHHIAATARKLNTIDEVHDKRGW